MTKVASILCRRSFSLAMISALAAAVLVGTSVLKPRNLLIIELVTMKGIRWFWINIEGDRLVAHLSVIMLADRFHCLTDMLEQQKRLLYECLGLSDSEDRGKGEGEVHGYLPHTPPCCMNPQAHIF